MTTGEREIEPAEAAVVERIFREFIGGVDHRKQIAKTLNQRGCRWSVRRHVESEHHLRHAKRGTGILNNELYVGRMVWNRLRYVKNPDTGKRVSRLNPQPSGSRRTFRTSGSVRDDLVAAKERAESTRATRSRRPASIGFGEAPAVPVLRPDEVRRVRRRIHHGRPESARVLRRSRPGHVLNQLTIRRDEVEARVLKALQDKLLRQDLFEEFCDEFTREMNRLRMEHRASLSAAEREIERIETSVARS